MKLHLQLHDESEAVPTLPFEGCTYLVVPDRHCQCAPKEELQIAGYKGKERIEDGGRRVVSEVGCRNCGGSVGILTVETGSLFGPEEDQRTLKGRCRVY